MTTKLRKLLPVALTLGILITPAAARADLFFSEYVEGSGNNKALEIFNPTGAAVDLAAEGYDVQMFFNGAAAAGLTIALTGSVAAGDVHVLAQASAAAAILAQADQTNSSSWYNGNDAVALRKAGVIIDVIGQIGFDPGVEWGSGLTSTMDNTLRRMLDISVGDANGTDAFDPSVQWIGYAIDTFDGLGSHGVAEPGGFALLAFALAVCYCLRRRASASPTRPIASRPSIPGCGTVSMSENA